MTVSDDLFAQGIAAWANRVRHGELSFLETLQHCLARCKAEANLGAFECLDPERATAAATAMDQWLAGGTDLGPLMGVPLGVKDLMRVDGLPLTNGSNADTDHLVGPEGTVVKTLKAAGMVISGKTKTVEFALGVSGVNEARGTPWNPCDRDVHRLPGGSSSGSAVAMAAGQVGMALGTDTGGSVRIPACYTGLVGHKTSVRRWPVDGIFALSQTLDSVGPLCRTMHDAVLMHQIMLNEAVGPIRAVPGLRFGVPQSLFLEDLDDQVAEDFDRACAALRAAGAIQIDMDFPEAAERATLFPPIVPSELIATLTPRLFESIRAGMDPVTAQRAAHGLSVTAVEYLAAQTRRRYLSARANATFDTLDCWVSPTVPFLPMPLSELETGPGLARALLSGRNTQPGNLFEFCALSLPMHRHGDLPSGFQIMMPWGQDAPLLACGQALEPLLNEGR